MLAFQETLVEKVVELLGILRRDYCSKEYLSRLLAPLAQPPSLPQTPATQHCSGRPYLAVYPSGPSRPKVPPKRTAPRGPKTIWRQSPASAASKPTNKRRSASKARNRSLKAVSAKTQKKKGKRSKSNSKKRGHGSGSPRSGKENRQRFMNALKHVNPQDPGRFWLTGTLGRAKKQRKARKKSNSLNMGQRRKKRLSLSNLRKEEEQESLWGCRAPPGNEAKIRKVG